MYLDPKRCMSAPRAAAAEAAGWFVSLVLGAVLRLPADGG